MHPNDPSIEKYWDELIELLSENESETINYLKHCTKNEAEWVSEVFEDIAYNLQSNAYIESLQKINVKYPDLNLANIIEIAKDYIQAK